jgi:multiple sugar transport system permease protein
VNRGVVLLATAAVVSFCLGPFAWQLAVSLRPEHAAESSRHALTAANYVAVFTGRPFVRVLANSAVVALGTTFVTLAAGAGTAFALARLTFPGRRALLYAALAVSMFPPIATVSPLYLMLRALGLRDRVPALILPYTTFALPLTVWLLTSFFREIPDELYRAARVDGCTPFQAFRRVLLPLAAPGLASTAILVFIASWNEFLYALTFLSSPRHQTVPVAISLFSSEHEEPWGEISAASIVASLPLVTMTVLFQRRIVAGLTAGAVKG